MKHYLMTEQTSLFLFVFLFDPSGHLRIEKEEDFLLFPKTEDSFLVRPEKIVSDKTEIEGETQVTKIETY